MLLALANWLGVDSSQTGEIGLVIKKPVPEIREAAGRGAMQRVTASLTLNLNTPSVDRPHADGADTLIIERIPGPIIVSRLQYFQPVR